MFFCWDITIPADTREEEPLIDYLELPKGVITHVDMKFPAGCHGMVKARLFKEALQLVPLSEDEWVTGDDESVPTDTYAELAEYPFKLKYKLCSPDTVYDHTITIRIQVQPEYAVGTVSLTKMLRTALAKLGF